jgi:hypothetical protein
LSIDAASELGITAMQSKEDASEGSARRALPAVITCIAVVAAIDFAATY